MEGAAAIFREALAGRLEPQAAFERLQELYPSATFSNGFLHGRAGAERVAARG